TADAATLRCRLAAPGRRRVSCYPYRRRGAAAGQSIEGDTCMTRFSWTRALFSSLALVALSGLAQAQSSGLPWPPGDELGMANTLGSATWQRCAPHLSNPKAKAYELSHVRSNTMPQSPFGTPLVDKYRPTVGIPGTMHAFNGEETVRGEPGAQGTQMD